MLHGPFILQLYCLNDISPVDSPDVILYGWLGSKHQLTKILPWRIRVAFPGESQLRQSSATQPKVRIGCFSACLIHRTLTWTTGPLTCARDPRAWLSTWDLYSSEGLFKGILMRWGHQGKFSSLKAPVGDCWLQRHRRRSATCRGNATVAALPLETEEWQNLLNLLCWKPKPVPMIVT